MHRSIISAFTFALLMVGSQARADIILESATVHSTGHVGGLSVNFLQFLGARFTVGEPTMITQVGGHLGVEMGAGNGQLFAAIVALDGTSSLPSFLPSEISSNALASATFTAPETSSDILFDLSVILQPGNYGLIFGSEAFGATGSGFMPMYNVDTDSASYFYYNLFATDFASDTFTNGGLGGTRFVVIGQAAVPEPASFLLVGLGLAATGSYIRRKERG